MRAKDVMVRAVGVGLGTEGPVIDHSLFNRSAIRTDKPCINLIDRSP
jgi:hypothetical protein